MAIHNKDKRFDLKFSLGEVTEKLVEFMVEGGLDVEVKTEADLWLQTHALVFEYECRGQPSGIATTEADWWFHALTVRGECKGMYVFRVPLLRKRLREAFTAGVAKSVRGGDDNQSKMLQVHIFDVPYLMLD